MPLPSPPSTFQSTLSHSLPMPLPSPPSTFQSTLSHSLPMPLPSPPSTFQSTLSSIHTIAFITHAASITTRHYNPHYRIHYPCRFHHHPRHFNPHYRIHYPGPLPSPPDISIHIEYSLPMPLPTPPSTFQSTLEHSLPMPLPTPPSALQSTHITQPASSTSLEVDCNPHTRLRRHHPLSETRIHTLPKPPATPPLHDSLIATHALLTPGPGHNSHTLTHIIIHAGNSINFRFSTLHTSSENRTSESFLFYNTIDGEMTYYAFILPIDSFHIRLRCIHCILHSLHNATMQRLGFTHNTQIKNINSLLRNISTHNTRREKFTSLGNFLICIMHFKLRTKHESSPTLRQIHQIFSLKLTRKPNLKNTEPRVSLRWF
ncbi:hypothetical protein HNY73_014096 [Argiope bruennichi]|uniref:Uncharacterized protein n=1 Tax=Argiope bruennichi TaxID=94029 RepID=A0A8T0EMU1_ARGBR|nr:hypothetical protein HNY73_014096 [Argiope bruennichi]